MSAQLHPLARNVSEWEHWLTAQGEPAFRGKQVFRWLHRHAVFNAEQMTNLSLALRRALVAEGLDCPLRVERVERAPDGTRKLLLLLADQHRVECVLIPMTNLLDADAATSEHEDPEDPNEAKDPGEADAPQAAAAEPEKRVTLCISTQVGCAMGCVFCASGQAGLQRGLNAGEIVAQVLLAKGYLEERERLRNLVFMGMGEPLHHYEETRRAIELLTHPEGIGMSPRRITVSTVGLVPGIRRLGNDFAGKLGLAISLHAPDNATRDQILPMNRRFNVETLIDALKNYPLPRRRRITIEYTLIDGINDSAEHALRLVHLLRELRVKVNLIPMNPIEASALRAPSQAAVERFQRILGEHRVSCSVRQRRGDDVNAACGQLALRESALISADRLHKVNKAKASGVKDPARAE